MNSVTRVESPGQALVESSNQRVKKSSHFVITATDTQDSKAPLFKSLQQPCNYKLCRLQLQRLILNALLFQQDINAVKAPQNSTPLGGICLYSPSFVSIWTIRKLHMMKPDNWTECDPCACSEPSKPHGPYAMVHGGKEAVQHNM